MRSPLSGIFLSAALTFLAYATFVQFAPFRVPTAQNQNDTNLIRVQDYLQAPDRKVVLVGSSLTFRLPQLVLGPGIANLALAGEGAQTGLQIIRDSGARPGLVLIETNLLLHPGNAVLAHSQLRFPERALRQKFRVFRTGYDPVNLLWRGFAVLMHKADSEPVVASDITRQLTELQRREKSHPPTREMLYNSLGDTAVLVATLQARGIKVGFFEMPIDAGLTHSPFDEALRHAVLTTFPRDRFAWVPLPAAGHTVDGIHLNNEDAAIVAEQFVRWIRSNR
ncbi:MAG TPA: hypothetical protein VGH23_13855 [Rhizomicrobium sp.]|jgi:hypothetical protein